MKRTLEDIRDLPGELRAPCDWCHPCYTCRDLMRDSADEIERLREYRDHHEFVLSQIEALTRVKISTIDDVLAEIKGLNAVVAKLTRDYNSLEDDVRYNGEALARANEMKGEIDRLQAIVNRQHAALIVAGTECDELGDSDLHALACIAGTEDGRCEPSDDDYAEAYIRAVEAL